METIRDRLWIWGHLAGSHNGWGGKGMSVMSPSEGAHYIGARNVFMVSFGGNLQPPFDRYSKCLESMREVKFSIVGDGSSPEKGDSMGDLEEVIGQINRYKNVTGGILDDFFEPKRLKVYTREKLLEMNRRLKEGAGADADMWCVLYDHQLDNDLGGRLDAFDGVTFWTWEEHNLVHFERNYEKLQKVAAGKRKMLGIYLYEYPNGHEMKAENVVMQLEKYSRLLCGGEIEGIIFCSNTVMDVDYECVAAAKHWIAENGNRPVLKE